MSSIPRKTTRQAKARPTPLDADEALPVTERRTQEQRREMGAANGLVFQLVAEPRFDYRDRQDRVLSHDPAKQRWQRYRIERTTTDPLRPGEAHDTRREAMLRAIGLDRSTIHLASLFTARPPGGMVEAAE